MSKQTGLRKWRDSKTGRSLLEPKLTPTEQAVADRLRAEGYTVYRNGWPDLLCEKDGELRFVEIKKGDAPLRPEQRRMHKALKRCMGITVEVVRLYDASPLGGEGRGKTATPLPDRKGGQQ